MRLPRLRHVSLACALYIGTCQAQAYTTAAPAAPTASTYSGAASVGQVGEDVLNMDNMGEPFIHSRHTGTMPYWGDCYRCYSQQVSQPECQPGTPAQQLAEWSSSGDSSCGGTETDTFVVSAVCEQNGQVELDILNTSQNPAATVSQKTYTMDVTIGLGQSGVTSFQSNASNSCTGQTTGTVDFTCSSGSNSCSQGFDWYPIFSVSGATNNGTFVGSVSFGNYLSPSQYQSSGAIGVEYSEYATVNEMVCQHYPPGSAQCNTVNQQPTLPVYQWACDTAENGWQPGSLCANSLVSANGSEWIFGAPDGANGTAQSGYSVMQAQYVNPTSLSMPATLAFAADNYGWVWINGTQVGFMGGFGSPQTDPVVLPPGTDTIDFMVLNYPNSPPSDPKEYANPAAGILAISNSSGQPLIGSNDNEWNLVDNPPATPNPTPTSLIGSTGYTPQNCATGNC